MVAAGEILAGPASRIGPTRADEPALVRHFGPALGPACWRELSRKRRAGAPLTPEALGWPHAFFRDAVLHAREIRSRWTFLDLAADTGRLEAFAAAL